MRICLWVRLMYKRCNLLSTIQQFPCIDVSVNLDAPQSMWEVWDLSLDGSVPMLFVVYSAL